MSGWIRGRVQRLERRLTAPGSCRLCGGKPRVKVLVGEDEALPEPCARCGREWIVIRILRGIPPPEWAARQKERPDRAPGP